MAIEPGLPHMASIVSATCDQIVDGPPTIGCRQRQQPGACAQVRPARALSACLRRRVLPVDSVDRIDQWPDCQWCAHDRDRARGQAVRRWTAAFLRTKCREFTDCVNRCASVSHWRAREDVVEWSGRPGSETFLSEPFPAEELPLNRCGDAPQGAGDPGEPAAAFEDRSVFG